MPLNLKSSPCCVLPRLCFSPLLQEIWSRRFEFWFRKASGFPATVSAAKKEACVIASTKVTDFTYKQLATAGVWGLQIFGCFCIGEAIARRDFRGYPVFLPKEAHH
jgi:hypothetical protein